MNATQYTSEIQQFMLQENKHGKDFKTLVLRLLSLYNDNVKLVSAMTYVPEALILKWKSEWNKGLYNPEQVDFVSDGSLS